MFTQKQKDLFWSSVLVGFGGSCWNWNKALDKHGYGKVKIGGKYYISHRAAFEMYYNKKPGRMHVLHNCDNPKCCNPAHLRLGTHYDNMQDCKNKGRQATIIKTRVKLSQEKADKLRKDFINGASKLALSRKYLISPVQVRAILDRKHWKETTYPPLKRAGSG